MFSQSDFLLDRSYWDRDGGLSRLLSREPMSFLLASRLLGLSGRARAEFFLRGYFEVVPVEYVPDVTLYRDEVHRGDVWQGGSFVLDAERFERAVKESVRFSGYRFSETRQLCEVDWVWWCIEVSRHLGPEVVVGMFRELVPKEHELFFRRLGEDAAVGLVGALHDAEYRFFMGSVPPHIGVMVASIAWKRACKVFGYDIDNQAFAKILRCTLPEADRENGERLSLREKAILAGHRHFTVHDGYITKNAGQLFQEITEKIAKEAVDDLIRDLVEESRPQYKIMAWGMVIT